MAVSISTSGTCPGSMPIAVVAARIADRPVLADLIEEAIALVGSDVLHDRDGEGLSRRLDEIEDDLQVLDQRFYDLENTADLDTAQSRLVTRLP